MTHARASLLGRILHRSCKSTRRFRRRGANTEPSLLKRILCLSIFTRRPLVFLSQLVFLLRESFAAF
jgi:hypothetical protein